MTVSVHIKFGLVRIQGSEVKRGGGRICPWSDRVFGIPVQVHVPNFGGCQGRRTGVEVTTVSNLLILGGWVTKVLKNCNKKIGGW